MLDSSVRPALPPACRPGREKRSHRAPLARPHLRILHFAFCILHFAFCILHFAFCILHFAIFIAPAPRPEPPPGGPFAPPPAAPPESPWAHALRRPPACFRDDVVRRLPRQSERKPGSRRFPWDFPARNWIQSSSFRIAMISLAYRAVAGPPHPPSRVARKGRF
jgi:hypothetical protein